ncbi:hypothetical protein MIND_00922100 [Mycena indigotica]|uniref:F-box domain-containing protein n=1 Tax=Mycena indigotica TaxID=2126181 RepID=A0A8H6SDE6_9AGAR|nr:uncharacterized protein MIND_00922100 [Mycena indigotica]KAF7296903.1 hypothetical protein MIND_00922100 [Mycena indigotica]
MLRYQIPPDILRSIFSHCDVASALAIGTTCRRFHQLARARELWVALCVRLQQHGVLPLAATLVPPLAALSTNSLVELVKRVVHGPRTWACAGDLVPEVRHEIRLRVPIPRLHSYLENEVKMLPSGKYVLFCNNRRLQCWDTASGRLLWTHAAAVERADVAAFAAEEGEDGALRVVVGLHAGRNCSVRGIFVEVVEVDLRTRVQHRLILTRPAYEPDEDGFSQPCILGPLAAMVVGDNRIYLLDWTTRAYLFIDVHGQFSDDDESFVSAFMPAGAAPSASRNRVALIPGYIVLKTAVRKSFGGDELLLVAHSALEKLWTRLPDNYDATKDWDEYEPEGVLARQLKTFNVSKPPRIREPGSVTGQGSDRRGSYKANRGKGKGKERWRPSGSVGRSGRDGRREKLSRPAARYMDCFSVSTSPLRDDAYRIWVRETPVRGPATYFDDPMLANVAWDDLDDALDSVRQKREDGDAGGELVAYDITLNSGLSPVVKRWCPGGRFKPSKGRWAKRLCRIPDMWWMPRLVESVRHSVGQKAMGRSWAW